MAWLDHDRLGFNYRMSDVTAAIGVAQVARLDELLAGRDRVAALYGEALAGIDGLELYRGPAGRGEAKLVRLPGPTARREPTATRVIARLGEEGIPAKAYLPCIHLMPHLRELGYGEGDFPVAEGISARSLALPFHAGLDEGDVTRVAAALEAALS